MISLIIKKKRTILFFVFILLFLAATAATILYAQGYRVRLSWPPSWDQTLQRTGMLMLETTPRGAKVHLEKEGRTYLFGDNISDPDENGYKTPTKIKHLTPGEYQLTLKREGYWSWEKKVQIDPGRQTKIENISLFKKGLPLQIAEASPQEFKVSPSGKYAILAEENVLISLQNGERQDIPAKSRRDGKDSFSQTTNWSPNEEFFITDGELYKREGMERKNSLEEILGVAPEKIRWTDGSTFHYYNEGTINRYNIDSSKKEKLLEVELEEGERILDCMIKEGYIHLLIRNTEKMKYQIFFLEGGKKRRELEFPYSSDYTFTNKDHSLINIHDQRYNTLYLVDPNSLVNPVRHLVENVQYLQWKNEKELLYANDLEIWTYDTEDNKKSLLTRISSVITGIDWHDSGNYIIYYTDSSINAVEASAEIGTSRDITTLADLHNIFSPYYDRDKNVIYFIADLGKKDGIYKLNI